jgi:hypothetical protein
VRVLEHRPAAIDAWVQTWRTRFTGQPVAVGLELQNGPMRSALRTAAFLGLLPVHPLTRAQYRAACTPSRATADPTEAELPVERRRTHRDQRTPLAPQRPTMRALAPLVDHRRRVVGDHVRRTNRLTRARKHDCPHVLPWVQEHETGICGDCLRPWPTLKAAPRARRTTRARCFRAPHGRAADVLTPRIEAIQSAGALTTAAGVITANTLLVPARVAHLRVPWPAIADCAPALAPRAQDHPDCPLFDALPGAGAVCAPRRRVAFGAPRARDAAAEARQQEAGIAPVTARRGKQAWGHWRLQGPTFLRHTCVAWAAESPRPACWAQVSSQQPRDTGKAHQAAVRAVACTGLRLRYRWRQARTPYDASVYRHALKRRRAPLLHHVAHGVCKGVKNP